MASALPQGAPDRHLQSVPVPDVSSADPPLPNPILQQEGSTTRIHRTSTPSARCRSSASCLQAPPVAMATALPQGAPDRRVQSVPNVGSPSYSSPPQLHSAAGDEQHSLNPPGSHTVSSSSLPCALPPRFVRGGSTKCKRPLMDQQRPAAAKNWSVAIWLQVCTIVTIQPMCW